MLLKLQRVFNNRVLIRFRSDRGFFRVLIGKVLFKVFSDFALSRVLSIRILLRVLGLLVLSKVIISVFPICLLKLINIYV